MMVVGTPATPNRPLSFGKLVLQLDEIGLRDGSCFGGTYTKMARMVVVCAPYLPNWEQIRGSDSCLVKL